MRLHTFVSHFYIEPEAGYDSTSTTLRIDRQTGQLARLSAPDLDVSHAHTTPIFGVIGIAKSVPLSLSTLLICVLLIVVPVAAGKAW